MGSATSRIANGASTAIPVAPASDPRPWRNVRSSPLNRDTSMIPDVPVRAAVLRCSRKARPLVPRPPANSEARSRDSTKADHSPETSPPELDPAPALRQAACAAHRIPRRLYRRSLANRCRGARSRLNCSSCVKHDSSLRGVSVLVTTITQSVKQFRSPFEVHDQ